MNKDEVTVYDFTKVMIEVSFDNYRETDVSKTLGNVIHQEMYIPVILNILKDPGTNMVVSAKLAVIEILTPKK